MAKTISCVIAEKTMKKGIHLAIEEWPSFGADKWAHKLMYIYYV